MKTRAWLIARLLAPIVMVAAIACALPPVAIQPELATFRANLRTDSLAALGLDTLGGRRGTAGSPSAIGAVLTDELTLARHHLAADSILNVLNSAQKGRIRGQIRVAVLATVISVALGTAHSSGRTSWAAIAFSVGGGAVSIASTVRVDRDLATRAGACINVGRSGDAAIDRFGREWRTAPPDAARDEAGLDPTIWTLS